MGNRDQFYTFRGYEMLNRKHEGLTPSMEDYLEMIYRICVDEEVVRMNQLAGKLHVRVSSCTKIIQKLNRLGLVNYEKYSNISLTNEGKKIGEFLLHRHEAIEKFLSIIGVKDTLLKDTEQIEHYISLKLLRNLELLNLFFCKNPEILNKYYKFIEDLG